MKLNRTGSILDRVERNKINDNWDKIENFISSNGESLFEDESFKHWLNKNKITPKESVQSFYDLPSNATKGDLRAVVNENKVYMYDGYKWNPQYHLNFDILEEIKGSLVSTQNNMVSNYTMPDISPKVIFNSSNQYFIITQKPNKKGYVRFGLRDDIVATNASVGGKGELLRITEVLNVKRCAVRKFKPSLMHNSDEWYVNSTSDEDGQTIDYYISSVKTEGIFIEYDINVPDGVFATKVQILKSNGASTNVKITVDGREVDNRSFKGSGFDEFYVPVVPGKHKIRFTSTVTGYLSIVGVNVVELKDFKEGYNYDSFVSSVETTNNPYIVNSGALDYAILDADTGLWTGSYHGGETRRELKIKLDSEDVTLTSNQFKVGNIIEIEQRTNINNKLESFSRQEFKHDASRTIELHLKGEMNVTTLFTNMSTTHSDYIDVLYPHRLVTDEDKSYYLGVGSNYVIQRNPTNNQKVITLMNNVSYPLDTPTNQTYIKRTINNLYNKLYRANIQSSSGELFTEGSFITTHIFE